MKNINDLHRIGKSSRNIQSKKTKSFGYQVLGFGSGKAEAAEYVVATGGSPCAGATSGDYKIHSFTGNGTLCVSSVGNCAGSNTVDYLVVAGGAGGGADYGGGGGAGHSPLP